LFKKIPAFRKLKHGTALSNRNLSANLCCRSATVLKSVIILLRLELLVFAYSFDGEAVAGAFPAAVAEFQGYFDDRIHPHHKAGIFLAMPVEIHAAGQLKIFT